MEVLLGIKFLVKKLTQILLNIMAKNIKLIFQKRII